MHAPIAPGEYVVTVTGMTPGSYSVDVVATVALCARDAAEESVLNIKAQQAKIKVTPRTCAVHALLCIPSPHPC
jgi:hypothetical protein